VNSVGTGARGINRNGEKNEGRNQAWFNGMVIQLEPVRYTPAGIPILNLRISHESEVSEAGFRRRIHFELAAVAAGDLAFVLSKAGPGSVGEFGGFLAPRSRNSKTLVFHICVSEISKTFHSAPDAGIDVSD